MKLGQLIAMMFYICIVCCVHSKPFNPSKESKHDAIAQMKADTNKVIFLCDYAWELRRSYPDSATEYLGQAINISRKLKYREGEAQCYNILGVIAKDQGQFDEALTHLNYGLELRVKLGTLVDVAKSLNNIGIVYRHKGDYDLALQYFLESQTIRERIGDSVLIALGFQNIGVFYQSQGDNEHAIEYFERSILINKKLPDKSEELSKTYNNLGGIYFFEKKYDKALELYRESLMLKIAIGDKRGIGNTWNNIGLVFEAKSEIENALDAYQKSIELRKAIGDQEGIGVTNNNIGVLHQGLGNNEKALSYFLMSHSVASALGILDLARQSAENLSSAYALLGRYEEALHYHQRFTVLKDSLVNEEKAKEIGRLEASFEAQKEIDAKAAEVRVRTYQRNATFAGLGLVSLLAFVVIRGYHYRQRAARLLADQKEKTNAQLIVDLLRDQEVESLAALMEGQEQERKRIASDLHDRLGSKLATVRLHVGGISEALPANKELQQYDIATRLLDEACHEVRQIAHNMASGVLTHFGLVPALHEMATTLRASGQLDVQVYAFEMEGRRMESRVEIALYRVTQELISNVLKHARATEVAIHLTHHETSLNVIVEDNGSGFVYDVEKPQSSGMGLGSIRHRIESLGGQLTIDTAPAKGTAILIDLPMEAGKQLPA